MKCASLIFPKTQKICLLFAALWEISCMLHWKERDYRILQLRNFIHKVKDKDTTCYVIIIFLYKVVKTTEIPAHLIVIFIRASYQQEQISHVQ